ncbi:ABC transporter ATP-binding protein/permease [Opitutales bacterium]|nr:ABC transporter ATP-binding protein/permease [Opitutales bacterium]
MKKNTQARSDYPKISSLLPYFLHLKPYWVPFTGALFFGVIYGISSGFGLPFMTDQIFPRIFPSNENAIQLTSWEIFIYVCWFPLVFLIRGVSSFFNSYLINFCGMKVLEKIRIEVFAKIQRLPLAFFQRHKSGDLLSRVTADTAQLQSAVLSVSNDLIRQPITFIGAITALAVMAIQREGMAFVLLCLVAIPLCVFPIRRIGSLLMRKALDLQQRAGGLSSVLNENLSGPAEIRSLNLQDREIGRFREQSEKFLTARMKVVKYSHILTPLIEIITATGISVAIFQAARTSIHLDAVVPVIVALYMSYEPVKKLGSIHNTIKEGLASLKRLQEVLHAEETITEPQSPTPLKEINGKLEFNNVSFHYPVLEEGKKKHATAIDCMNLTINPGEVVAIVGPSGAGKTTLAGLLNRLHDPTSGIVLLDGKDLRDLSLVELREAIASVPQKPFLFDDTIEENIRLGESIHSRGTVEEALKKANAWEFVSSMDMKTKQKIGEKGSRVSGGQLQRLALARAFYRNSPILLLDEATSALDTESEEKIQQAMKKLTQGKTTIMIAHRFSSIRLANRILVMEAGKFIADGSHDEVYKSCHLYRTLFDNQTE